jgi:hypothetical protein
MHVVQAPVNNVVGVITMRYCLVSAARPMNMVSARIKRLALIRILFAHFKCMLIIVILMWMM